MEKRCRVACEAFAPEVALALAARLEIHYTPKHGSWLNMAETELSVLARQCLDRRPRPDGSRNCDLASRPQRRHRTHQLAVQDRRCQNQVNRLYPSFEV